MPTLIPMPEDVFLEFKKTYHPKFIKKVMQTQCHHLLLMAGKTEREGFEPSVRSCLPYNRLAICRFRPLSHLSWVTNNNSSRYIFTSQTFFSH